MSKRERQAYRQGQKDMLKILASMVLFGALFIAALIKAGIYVI